MNKILIVAVCLFVYIFPANAQGTKVKGFLVLNNGDTLQGWISYKNRQKVSGTVNLYRDSASKIRTTYNIADVQYFDIGGYDAYTRATVEHTVPIGFVLPNTSSLNDTVIKETVFLKVILKGSRLGLYQCMSDPPSYYIMDTDAVYIELRQKRMTDGLYDSELPVYRGQLIALAIKYGKQKELEAAIDHSRYDEESLKDIVTKLNGDTAKVYYTAAPDKMKLSFFAGGGAGIATVRLSGDKTYFGSLAFNKVVIPYLAAGIDISSRRLQAVVFRLELVYSSASYRGQGLSASSSLDTISYKYQQSNISPGLSFLYRFLNKNKLKVYAGVGMAWNLSSYKENAFHHSYVNVTIQNYIPMSKQWIGGNLKLGTVINNRWETGLVGHFSEEYTNTAEVGFKQTTYYIWIGYHFK